MLVMRDDLHACRFRVYTQVARCRKIGIHAHYTSEQFRERQGEESHACVEIERIAALGPFQHAFQHLFDQKAIYLEKRKVTDAERKSTGMMRQVARAGKLKAVFAFIQQEQ